MKHAREIKVDNRVRTVIKCQSCGATTYVNAGIDTKTAKAAMERTCKVCIPPQNLPNNQGWWLEFGLDKNPYIYGPMPRLRTGLRYRMEEARRMGWMTWVWHDEYEEDRKGVQPQLQATKK